MDVPRGFKAPFQDRTWPAKLGIGIVVGVLGITGPALIGYEMAYMRSVSVGDERLPEWNGFLQYWVRGFAVLIALIPYVVVGLLLFGIGIIPALILFAAAIVEYAMTDRWSSMFSLRDLWHRIRANDSFWQALLVTYGISALASAIIGRAGNPTGTFVVNAIVQAFLAFVGGHLFGQWANEAFVSATTTPNFPSHMPGGGYQPPPPPPPPVSTPPRPTP